MTKPAPGPDQPPIPVRLVTFNIHHGVGDDGRHDLPRLAQVLAAADADVICLQEVDRHYGDRSENVDQGLLLARPGSGPSQVRYWKTLPSRSSVSRTRLALLNGPK